MTFCDNKTLKRQADAALSGVPGDPRRLVLIHTGVSVGIALVLMVLDFFLSKGIEDTGGLAGIGNRAILQTIRQILFIANAALMPFWEQGIRRFGLCVSRGEPVSSGTLLEGFRRFGPLFRLAILRILIVFVLVFICSNIASVLLMLSPAAGAMMESVMPYMEQMYTDPSFMMDQEAMLQAIPEATMLQMTVTILVIMGVLLAVTCLPVLYLFRLADMAILDEPKTGARQAMGISFRAIVRQPLRLLKLDLSYWWYYALQTLCLLVGYGDVLLEAFGVTLPFSSDAAYFVFYLLYAAGLTLLLWLTRGKVETTYACAYDMLRES